MFGHFRHLMLGGTALGISNRDSGQYTDPVPSGHYTIELLGAFVPVKSCNFRAAVGIVFFNSEVKTTIEIDGLPLRFVEEIIH